MSADQTSAGYETAVAWMNRGYGLLARDDSTSLVAAIEAYEHAIRILRDPRSRRSDRIDNSLGAALMNRGYLQHRLHGLRQAEAALESYGEAIELFGRINPVTGPWIQRNLAGTLVNRANLWLDLGQPESARSDAIDALTRVRDGEFAEPADADLALKARRTGCDAIGQMLARTDDPDSLAADMADVVDDALRLVRFWEGRGVFAFRELALRVFRIGTRLNAIHQPHFLAEFILENIDPAISVDALSGINEMHGIAVESCEMAQQRLEQDRFLFLGNPDHTRLLEIRSSLISLKRRLEQLRPSKITGAYPRH